MKTRLLLAALLATALAGRLPAANEEPAPDRKKGSEPWRAQMIEDAKKQAAKPAPKSAPAPAKSTTVPAPATPGAPAPDKAAPTTPGNDKAPIAPAATGTETTPAATAATEPKKDGDPALLPKVEVNRTKPTELGRMMYEQEKEIAREKQLTKSTELDKALNNSKVSLPVFGGQTTSSRESIAAERVSLMEAEKDLIEEIAHAKTKADKAKLEKELAEIKKIRRELEHSIR